MYIVACVSDCCLAQDAIRESVKRSVTVSAWNIVGEKGTHTELLGNIIIEAPGTGVLLFAYNVGTNIYI